MQELIGRGIGRMLRRGSEAVRRRFADEAEDVPPRSAEAAGFAPGSGSYVQKNEDMSDLSRRYQVHNGGRPGEAYRLEGLDGNPVDFDAYEGGTLIDSKAHYEHFFKDGKPREWWRGDEELIAQAKRQAEAARGKPIEWRFLEREPARHYADRFERAGIPIRVRHVPMDGG